MSGMILGPRTVEPMERLLRVVSGSNHDLSVELGIERVGKAWAVTLCTEERAPNGTKSWGIAATGQAQRLRTAAAKCLAGWERRR